MDFRPITTIASNLPSVTDGNLIVTTDTGELFVDKNSSRIKLSDVYQDTEESIRSLIAPVIGKLYFATDTHKLLQASYSGSTVTWTVLNEGGSGSSTLSGLSDVTISSPSSGQALVYNGSTWANNTVSGSGGTVYDSATYSLKSVGSLHTDLGNFSTDLVSYYDGTYYGPKGEHSTTIGGSYNTVTSYSSTVLGGVNNTVTGAYSTALGGSANTVSGDCSTTVGGTFNYVSGNDAIHTGVQSRGSVNSTISCNDRSAYPAYFSNYNMYGLCGIKGIAVPWNYSQILEKNLWNIDPNGAYVFRVDVIVDADVGAPLYSHNYLVAKYDITISSNTIQNIVVTPSTGLLDASCFSIVNGKLHFQVNIETLGYIYRADMQFGIFYTMYTNIAEGGSSSSSSSGG